MVGLHGLKIKTPGGFIVREWPLTCVVLVATFDPVFGIGDFHFDAPVFPLFVGLPNTQRHGQQAAIFPC